MTSGDDELRERGAGQPLDRDLGLPRRPFVHHVARPPLEPARQGIRGVVGRVHAAAKQLEELARRDRRPAAIELVALRDHGHRHGDRLADARERHEHDRPDAGVADRGGVDAGRAQLRPLGPAPDDTRRPAHGT